MTIRHRHSPSGGSWPTDDPPVCGRALGVAAVVCLLLSSLGLPGPAHGQTPPQESPRKSLFQRINLGGAAGFSAETYTASGIRKRRPSSTGKLYANLGASAHGFSYRLDLNISSEETALRQSLSRGALAIRYKWVSATFVDASPSYSSYSMRGVSVRGAAVELDPGRFLISAVGGRTQRAVEPSSDSDFREAAFERWLYAGRLGYGDQRRTHINVIGVYAKDDENSLQNPGDLLPAENLSFTGDGAVQLWRNRVEFKGQLTGSALTRDVRTAETKEDLVPAIYAGLIKSHVGTSFEYASVTSAAIKLRQASLRVDYERVEPGFESLGLQRTRNDQEIIKVQPTITVLSQRLRLGGNLNLSRNNLNDDRQATLRRTQLGLNAAARVSQQLNVSSSYSRLVNENDPEDDSPAGRQAEQEQVAQTFTLAPVLVLRSATVTHTVSLSGNLQKITDESPAVLSGERPGAEADNMTATISYAATLPSGLSLTAAGSMLDSKTEGSEMSSVGLNMGASFGLLERNLLLSTGGGWSSNEVTTGASPASAGRKSTQLTFNMSASYKLESVLRSFSDSTLRLSVRGLSSDPDVGDSFQEVRSDLRFDKRF